MASAVAHGRFLRIGPRKVRAVADLIRGKSVAEARNILAFTVKGASPVVSKVLESAVANAESMAAERRERIDADEMIVKELLVDGGSTLRRYQPAPRGRATRIRKRTSHIKVMISDD